MSLAVRSQDAPHPGEMLRQYRPPADVYDEMFSAPGIVRPHWQKFVAALEDLGADELRRRWEQARRIIHENGVTYNVFGDPQGMDRPWELDALPLLLPAAEWTALSAGLIQRARLLNLILADLYGPQRLLQSGHLPPELVFPNPGFLRPSCGYRAPQDVRLHLYAAHLGRRRAGIGACWPTAPRRLRAPAMPWRTGLSSPGCCPACFMNARYGAWRRSS